MHPPLNLMFDLDDTLIHCNIYFDQVIDRFVDLMEQWFANDDIPREEIKKTQLEFDLAGIQTKGFKAERFPESFLETYEFYCHLTGRLARSEEQSCLWQLGYSVFDSDFRLYPHVFRTLSRLQREGHVLHLYTGGDPKIQRKKVEKVNLAPFFLDRIFVAQYKNREALETILRERDLHRESSWMIGNSYRTDIIPALECDIGAIYIPPISTWAFDQVDIPPLENERFLHATSIRNMPHVLKDYLYNERVCYYEFSRKKTNDSKDRQQLIDLI